MFYTFIESILWGVGSSLSALILIDLFDRYNTLDKTQRIYIVYTAFVVGCLRGYTGRDMISLIFM